jgi:AAA+ superfamily predicted ATPase
MARCLDAVEWEDDMGAVLPCESTAARIFGLRMLLQIPFASRTFHSLVTDPVVMTTLGLRGNRQTTVSSFQKQLKRRLAAELEKDPYAGNDILTQNIRKIASRIGLSVAESNVLHFAVLMYESNLISYLCDGCRGDVTGDTIRFLAGVCGESPRELAQALSTRGKLHMLGLLQVDPSMGVRAPIRARLDLMSEGLSMFTSSQFAPDELVERTSYPVGPTELELSDFPHLGDELQLAVRLLASALQEKIAGINILLWGKPGTGKSVCARLLSRAVSSCAREICHANREGEPMSGHDRLAALHMTTQMLSHQDDLLVVVDEMDEIAGSPHMGRLKSSVGKARLNECMETVPVPVIWVSNDARHFDPAILRRFTMVIGFSEIPAEVRKQIIKRRLAPFGVCDTKIEELARLEDLSPAAIGNVAKVLSVTTIDGDQSNDENVDLLVNGQLIVLSGQNRRSARKTAGHERSEIDYDVSYLNADVDLGRLVDRIKQLGEARLCLFGPPGTGKTAFGKEVARQLDKELLVRRASDLLGAYVGDTEKAIAAMFEQAERDGSVLLIDEAESFLFDRAGANHRWEVSHVNEFLTRMEDFSGVMICSTNLANRLDGASGRRFDLQIEFRPLAIHQAMKVLARVSHARGFDAEVMRDGAFKSRLAAAMPLTIGDINKALTGGRLIRDLNGMEDVLMSIERVAKEKRGREGRPIGFV